MAGVELLGSRLWGVPATAWDPTRSLGSYFRSSLWVETLGWRLWGGDTWVETQGGARDDLGPNAEPRKLFPKLPVGGDAGVETLAVADTHFRAHETGK